MRTKQEVRDFLDSLQWGRFTKKELEKKCQDFFDTKNKLDNATDPDCKELDYAFIFTNGVGCCAHHFIDIEIYYLNMRQRGWVLITGAELLMYEE